MIDDFDKNQRNTNEYLYDEELNGILNNNKDEDTTLMKREMYKSQKERKIRKQGLFLIRLRGLLRFLITLAVLYFTYRLMTAARWYLPKDTITSYKIKRIEIVGNKITPTYKVINAINDIELPQKPIYMINTDEFSQKISALASVKKVYVKRLWSPARIIIYIEEKEPIIVVAPSKDVLPIAYFSKEGTLVGRDYMPLPEGYNPILVLTYGNQNDDYTKWNRDRVLAIEKLAKTLEKLSGEKVQYIDMRKPDDIFVKLTSTKIRIGELDSTTYDRIKDIKSLLDKKKVSEKEVQYIDVSWGESKYFKLGPEEDDNEDAVNVEEENSDSTN